MRERTGLTSVPARRGLPLSWGDNAPIELLGYATHCKDNLKAHLVHCPTFKNNGMSGNLGVKSWTHE